MSMDIKQEFQKHQLIWDDCYLGYVILKNQSQYSDQRAIQNCFSENHELVFYPWLGDSEYLKFPTTGLNEISLIEFKKSFISMANRAIAYGSHQYLSENELECLLNSFLLEFENPNYYSNFTKSGWNPVTNHSRDSLLCLVSENNIGMWLSCDDE